MLLSVELVTAVLLAFVLVKTGPYFSLPHKVGWLCGSTTVAGCCCTDPQTLRLSAAAARHQVLACSICGRGVRYPAPPVQAVQEKHGGRGACCCWHALCASYRRAKCVFSSPISRGVASTTSKTNGWPHCLWKSRNCWTRRPLVFRTACSSRHCNMSMCVCGTSKCGVAEL